LTGGGGRQQEPLAIGLISWLDTSTPTGNALARRRISSKTMSTGFARGGAARPWPGSAPPAVVVFAEGAVLVADTVVAGASAP
jgi:hypothetical protein